MVERTRYRLRFADGEALELGARTAVMGVLNLTPDSFSDGGRYPDLGAALAAAEALIAAGADLVDVGGESTRPGADEVPADEERRRVVPLISALRAKSRIRISIDTRKAVVARAALDAGADLVNDVSALGDPGMLPLLVEREVPVVLMHMRGDPATMQRDTTYADVVSEVAAFLARQSGAAVRRGVADDRILVDPGIGFGKSAAGSLALLGRLPVLGAIGRPILIGASRKSFLGAALGLPAGEREEASLAVAAWAAAEGAHVIRAHDVRGTARVLRVIDALRAASGANATTNDRCSSE